ncbi:hypothetical protein J6590_101265, partial [Homalodisca vitripennis]
MGTMTAISYHLPSPPPSIIRFPPPSPSPTLTTLSDITRSSLISISAQLASSIPLSHKLPDNHILYYLSVD